MHTHTQWFFIADTQPRARPHLCAFVDSEVLTEKGSVNQQAVVSEPAAAASFGVRGHMFLCHLRRKAHKSGAAPCAAGASATARFTSVQQAATVKQQKRKGKFHTGLSFKKWNLKYASFSSTETHADLRTEQTWVRVSSQVRQPNHD